MLELNTFHNKHRIGHTLMSIGLLLAVITSFIGGAMETRVTAIGSSEVHGLSNQQRTANGLSPYTWSNALAQAAQAKANHMVANSYFAHTAPDGTTGWYFISQQGYGYTSAGENLAASNQDSADVVQGWMDSSSHRANLLSTNFTEVGYGVAYIGDWSGYSDITFVVALYAKPKTVATASNSTGQTTTNNSTTTKPKSTSTPSLAATPQQSEVNTTTAKQPEVQTPTTSTNNTAEVEPKEIAAGAQVNAIEHSILSAKFKSTMLYGSFALASALIAGGFVIELRKLFRHGHHGIAHL